MEQKTKRKVINLLGVKIKYKVKDKTKEVPSSDSSYNTILYTIEMLKAYGIRYIVTSPGCQNAVFNYKIQHDDYFKCISVVDERSAVYVAAGIAQETQEAVVVACTGATASRNYLSGLTECYYSNLGVIALTFFNYDNNEYNLGAQFTDRKITQNDIKRISVQLPQMHNNQDKKRCLTYLNTALSTAVYKNSPVHINIPSTLDYHIANEQKKNKTESINDIWTTKYYYDEFEGIKDLIKSKKTAIFIGSHGKFKQEETKAISDFAQSYSIPVICDHTSNYHGANKILVKEIQYTLNEELHPDLVIDIGGITGEYALFLFEKAEIWRISELNEFNCRYDKPVSKIFMMKEKRFFSSLINSEKEENGYYNELTKIIQRKEYSDLPLCMPLVCQKTAEYIGENALLHLSILNSLRCMNYFRLSESINVRSNVGGFGIDGAVSTLIGQSLVTDKKCFLITGDLAFFYDMNAIGQRDIKNNIRILMVNNNRGVEFRINPALEKTYGEETDNLIAAAGHFKGGAKAWAEACGFTYLSCDTKEGFLSQIKDFCTLNYDKPVFFEVFTSNEDEICGFEIMNNMR